MQIDAEKTNIMVIRWIKNSIKVALNGETMQLPSLYKFKYLGGIVDSRGGYEE